MSERKQEESLLSAWTSAQQKVLTGWPDLRVRWPGMKLRKPGKRRYKKHSRPSPGDIRQSHHQFQRFYVDQEALSMQ